MSSFPFCLGLEVVDEFKYNLPDNTEINFIMRGKDRRDVYKKLRESIITIPENMVMFISFIGTYPDKPIPVSRCFTEIHIKGKSTEYPLLCFGEIWVGKRKLNEEGEQCESN